MSEQPETSSRESAADRSTGLVATKLYLPRTPPGFVPRQRLVERLEQGLARELMLACAPAGFGKTAMLAEWSQRRRRPVAWLSLDIGDDDPVRFWRHAAAALDRVRPGIADRVTPLLTRPAPATFEGLVSALINELAADPQELVLVLDDYHLVDAHQVHTSMTFLLEHLPPAFTSCRPADRTPNCSWRGCGHAVSSPNYARTKCASPWTRRRHSSTMRSGPTYPGRR
ncbi:hypothetical protein ACIBL3_44695 [Kribbella sp. NPDC050124]|uniref:hypothetical protein n=1 Tax=Kribbella sp. NPDC050124 TaxID=3364114 RepID=UPI0037BA8FF4